MKLFYKNNRLNQLILLVIANLFLVSCGTYQSAYNDDGIYSDESPQKEEKKIIVLNEKQYDDYEQNYFTKKLESLQNIEGDDIFTDVDSYYYEDEFSDDNTNNENLNYNASQPWGYEDNNVVVSVNLMNNPFWGGGFNNWGWGFNNPWAFNNVGWGLNNWGWRGRRGFGRNWGFDTWGWSYNNWGFVNPYAGIGVWNNGYLHPFLPNFGITGFRNNRYANGNFEYGRRRYSVNADNLRRNRNVNSRNTVTNSRRSSSADRRYSNTISRNNNTTTAPTRRGTTTRRNTSPVRRSTTSSRTGSSSRNNNASSRRSSSSRNSNASSSSSRSSGSSSSSKSSSRSSSSRSSGRSSSSKRGN